MPKVSIVLPTYNGQEYLEQSVDSIINQSFKDWELIIVDDCSTDETASIADRYEKIDSRIHVIHNKKNEKLPGSLNIGFSSSRGQYLTWTSDDNLYLPNAIRVMAEYLDMHDGYMVCARMYVIDCKGRIIRETETYSNEKMYVNNCLGACFMYRREVYEEIGDYDEKTFCVEDYDYWLRVLNKFGRIESINEILYKYRQHRASLSNTKRCQVKDQLARLRLRYMDKIMEVIDKDKDALCSVYFEMLESGYMEKELVDYFQQKIPELRNQIEISDKNQYIIFGAGQYGEKAANMLGKKAVFFADSNVKKIGQKKCGLEILSFENAVSLSSQYTFVIAITGKNRYEMIAQLQNAGVKKYAVFLP